MDLLSFFHTFLFSSESVVPLSPDNIPNFPTLFFQFQKMWLAARVMGSPPRKRCSFRGTSLPSNGSGCTGWEPASITSGTPASSTPQCSVSPTPRHWPTTYSQRSTAVPVSTGVQLLNAARLSSHSLLHVLRRRTSTWL